MTSNTKSALIGFSIATLLVAAGWAFTTDQSQASTLTQIENASYELYKNGSPICSGTFISPTEFLTAAHCTVDEKAQYSVRQENHGTVQEYALKLNKVKPNLDTATFTVVDGNASFPFVDVAPVTVKPTVGSDVILAGFPDVENIFFISQGLFLGERPGPALRWDLAGSPLYEISLWAIPGNSGSGLYTVVNGEYLLIGTLSGGPNDFVNFTSTVSSVHQVY